MFLVIIWNLLKLSDYNDSVQVSSLRHIRRGDTIRSHAETAHYEKIKASMEQCYANQSEEFCLKWLFNLDYFWE